jgi:hypothetical protein
MHRSNVVVSAALSRLLVAGAIAAALVVLAAGVAFAHEERPAYFPAGDGEVPEYREPLSEPYVVVCKDADPAVELEDRFEPHRQELLDACEEDGFEHIQDAVFHVRDNHDVPGGALASCPGDTPEAAYGDRGEIPADHRRNVDCTTARGITEGFTDGTYRPADAVRRDQMASFIVRTVEDAEGAPSVPAAEESDDGFADIDGNVHEDRIRQAFAAGIAEGRSRTEYAPAMNIRRDQIASFVLRAHAFATGQDVAALESDEQAFDDVGPDNVHFRRVNGAAELGLVRGRSATAFEPAADTRRDQMATLMARLLAGLEDGEDGDVAAGGSTIYILPGTYREEPYRGRPDCADEVEENPEGGNGDDIGSIDGEEGGRGHPLSYDQHVDCPHAQNLIAILGQDENQASDENPDVACKNALCHLQLEGVGADREDVVIDGGFYEEGDGLGGTEEDYERGRFVKLNGIRADRADGIYMRNFTTQLFEFNAVYVLETDGFMIDDAVTRWNDEYGWLTFAVDHGKYQDCEGYGNGDSAIYPGSASDIHEGEEYHIDPAGDGPRHSVEITRCRSHGNALGYSGTAGNAVWAHDNDFYGNQTGIAMDSLFPDHPGLPQSHSRFENNRIYGNNVNFYEQYVLGDDAPCDRPYRERGYEDGVVCPVVPNPVGTGILTAGGNWNMFANNDVFDNWRFGFKLFYVPSTARGEPEDEYDTSHLNHYVGNQMGRSPEGLTQPNGTDQWWDDNGEGNCWQDNESEPGDFTRDPSVVYPDLPSCEEGGSDLLPPNLTKLATIATCATYDRDDNPDPPGCDWMETPDEPEGRESGEDSDDENDENDEDDEDDDGLPDIPLND